MDQDLLGSVYPLYVPTKFKDVITTIRFQARKTLLHTAKFIYKKETTLKKMVDNNNRSIIHSEVVWYL